MRRVRNTFLTGLGLATCMILFSGIGLSNTVGAVTSPSAVAVARGKDVALYHSPSSAKPYASLANPTSSHGPLVFLVSNFKLAPRWVRVYLPQRPNESEAWVRVRSVRLLKDPFEVHVNLSSHRLTVTKNSKTVVRASVGVGRSVLPTPSGTYYLTELLKQPNPSGEYGPYAFGTSAFSNVLQSFGGGPGQIGLHGTDVSSSVGKSVSHGCLRVHNALITKLAHLLPLGTPVVITRTK